MRLIIQGHSVFVLLCCSLPLNCRQITFQQSSVSLSINGMFQVIIIIFKSSWQSYSMLHKPSLVLFLMCVKLLFNLMWQQWNTEQHNTLCPCSIHVFCLTKHLCTHGILHATEFFFQGCKTKWPICFSFSLVKNPSERADLKSLMVGLYTSRLPNKNNNYYH